MRRIYYRPKTTINQQNQNHHVSHVSQMLSMTTTQNLTSYWTLSDQLPDHVQTQCHHITNNNHPYLRTLLHTTNTTGIAFRHIVHVHGFSPDHHSSLPSLILDTGNLQPRNACSAQLHQPTNHKNYFHTYNYHSTNTILQYSAFQEYSHDANH